MADRTDLDALLVSALYGELTPADEARLATHLESHPADRSALDDLRHTREGIRERRLLDAQHEPPPGLSARLMQEAARLSPRPITAGGFTGWIDRLRRGFGRGLMSHPAMAMAAMFVVVLGVFGTLYIRNGDMSIRTASTSPARVAAESRAAAAAAQSVPSPAAAPSQAIDPQQVANSSGSSYGVRLDEAEKPPPAAATTAVAATPAPAAAPPASPASQEDDRSMGRFASKLKAEGAVGYAPPAPPPAKPAAVDKDAKRGIELRRAEPTVKDIDDATYAKARRAKKAAAADQIVEDEAGASGGGVTAAPPPPSKISNAVSAPGVAANAAPSQQPSDGAVDGAFNSSDSNSPGWAQRQHSQVITAVRANNCAAAASAAAELFSRAPDYYRANVANDRSVAPCLAYVNRQIQVEERKAAAKRANANETKR